MFVSDRVELPIFAWDTNRFRAGATIHESRPPERIRAQGHCGCFNTEVLLVEESLRQRCRFWAPNPNGVFLKRIPGLMLCQHLSRSHQSNLGARFFDEGVKGRAKHSGKFHCLSLVLLRQQSIAQSVNFVFRVAQFRHCFEPDEAVASETMLIPIMVRRTTADPVGWHFIFASIPRGISLGHLRTAPKAVPIPGAVSLQEVVALRNRASETSTEHPAAPARPPSRRAAIRRGRCPRCGQCR